MYLLFTNGVPVPRIAKLLSVEVVTPGARLNQPSTPVR